MKRRYLAIAASAAIFIAVVILGFVLFREGVRRRAVFRPSDGETAETEVGVPSVDQWSLAFRRASPDNLEALLEAIESKHPDLYGKWSLGYLHARALIENDEEDDAVAKLVPYLAKDHPFRDLALYHRSEIAEDAEASRFRMMLIREYPQSVYREATIDAELEYRASLEDPQALIDLATLLAPAASTERRREMSARIVEALVKKKSLEEAFTRGLALLRGGTSDDAADRAARALDRPDVVSRLDTQQLALFGDAFHKHRHYDRAAALLQAALRRAYSDDLQFDLGRSLFGAEKFSEAQAIYLRGAGITKNANQKTTFLWHAARAAQLRGDDPTAERLMTAAIAVKGKFPSTTPALTQRLRTRLKQRRYADAASDLALLRRLAGNERAVLEGSLAYAVGMIAAKKPAEAMAALDAVPRKLLDEYDEAELAYWRGRALEGHDPTAAVRSYFDVLRSTSRSHFESFARARLRDASLSAALTGELKTRDAQVANLIGARQFDLARRIQSDRVLLSSSDLSAQLQRLRSIYEQLPDYRAVLELVPNELPRFPDVDAKDWPSLLMAMGLFDEAVPAIENRWGLRPAREALTRSYALNTAGAARPSIYAIEVMMKRVPDDFQYELLPPVVRSLLYPRYFRGFVAADAKRYEVDPALLFAIMREESRFDPRAKSQAAARGLLQFIITTARDIGRDIGLVDVAPEDLYDPRVIIRLGAKYIHELGEDLGGNRYRIAAAYNAGPSQTALWSRMQPAAGDDYFLTAVSFDETKGYVRKVMGSYERYR